MRSPSCRIAPILDTAHTSSRRFLRAHHHHPRTCALHAVYGLGMILWEMATRTKPWADKRAVVVIFQVAVKRAWRGRRSRHLARCARPR